MTKLYDMGDCTGDQPRYENGAMVQTFTVRANRVLKGHHASQAVVHAMGQFKRTLELNGVEQYAWPPSQDMHPHSDFRGLKVTFTTLCSAPKISTDMQARQ